MGIFVVRNRVGYKSKDLEIRSVEFDSKEYRETITLRDKILRKPLGMVFTPEFLAREVEDFHLAGYEDGELVCCLVLSALNQTEIQMRQVAVKEELQRQGLGKHIAKYSEDFAREKGFTLMKVHARELAVDFYLNMDYKIIDEAFTEVGIVHRRMIKQLKNG